MTEQEGRATDIHIYDRTKTELSGVTEVVSFSDANITLTCKFGTVSIDGEGLKVKAFDSASGNLSVTGRVDAVVYFDDGVRRRRFGRS